MKTHLFPPVPQFPSTPEDEHFPDPAPVVWSADEECATTVGTGTRCTYCTGPESD